MNWYKRANINKLASVTFWVEGSDQITQPMTKLDICQDLAQFIFYGINLGQKLGFQWDDIDPDVSSGDVFASTGQFNIYLRNKNIKSGIVENILNQYNEHKQLIELKLLEINKSGIKPDLNTARVIIVRNDTANLESLPEMNVANANANAIIQLLSNEGMGQLDPYGGTLDSTQLKTVISNIEQNSYLLDTYTKEPTEDISEGRPIIIDMGRSYERLKGYIDNLKKMINYIEKNNLPVKQINYG